MQEQAADSDTSAEDLRAQVRVLRAERNLWRVRSRTWERRCKDNRDRLREHGIAMEDDET